MTLARILIFAAFMLAVTGGARAENAVNVSAGEHGDHSRLVIAGANGDVQVVQSGRKVDIYFANPIDTFNFSDVNERRKAHRVLKATGTSGESNSLVRLQLNCDCSVKTMQLEGGKWVLDIYDAGAATREAKTQPQKTPATPSAKKKVAQNEKARDESADDRAEDLSVEQAHKRMIDLLQQAAEEGLVTIKSTGEKPAQIAQADGAAPRRTGGVETAQRGARPKAAIEENAPPPHACFADAAFAIDGARFEKNPLIEISSLQGQLAQAPAESQKAIVEELAGGFLAIGFGEEALALLADSGEAETLLADMARAVADKPVSPSGALLNAVDCRGAHALWQAAASDPATAVDRLKRSNDAVSSLPTRLRALLATRIAKKMIDAGDWNDASRLYEIASAASEIPSPRLQFIAAKLREHEGAIEESQEMLRNIAAGDSDASKDALLTLAEQYADGEAEPHEGFVDDIGALAKVERGSAAGAEAAFVEADIWAETGNVEASLLLLSGAAQSGPEKAGAARVKARRILSEALSSDDEEDRVDALSAYLEYREFVDTPGGESGFLRQVANAALDLGLPNVAFDALDNRALSGDRQSAQLKTRAALEAYNPEAALAAAAPYTNDPEFATVVVLANLQQQKFYAALAAASALPDSDRKSVLTAQSAWRAGDWTSAAQAFARIDPSLMGENMALQYALAAYMAGETAMPSAVEAVLRKEKSNAIDGAKSLFSNTPVGSVVGRGKALAASAEEEIRLVEEALGHG